MMKNQWKRSGLGWLCMLGLLIAASGCQDGLKARNQGLTHENQQLREELARARAAADVAVNERDALAAEIVRLQMAPQHQAAPQPPVGVNRGFGGIDGVEEIYSQGAVTVRVPGDVLFSSGRASLRTDAKRTLTQIANVLNARYAGNTIRIEGHSDSDPIRKSKWRDNYHLSEARATAVRDHLVSQGVSRGRMSIVSRGPDKPVASNQTRAGKGKNRRVEIVVITN